jgi:hydroxymethylglutaryl-CoA synthase
MHAAPQGLLLSFGAALPNDRVPAGRGRRCAARPDEDAVTLAAEAGAEALASAAAPPAALLLATTTPPYDEGGNAQALAELLGLPAETWVAELTATMRDGLAALRLGLALAAAQDAPVLVCAAHRSRAGERDAGDGAAAALVGPGDANAGSAAAAGSVGARSAGSTLASLHAGSAHTEELRDRWRLAGEAELREGDASFVHEFGAARVARIVGEAASSAAGEAASSAAGALATAVAGPNLRFAARAESALGGPGDPVAARTGVLGAAHPLLRLGLSLAGPATIVAASGGLAEAIDTEPQSGAAALADELGARAAGGTDTDKPIPTPSGEGFEPYASAPRAWRERAQDLRLEGARDGDRVRYPPPAGSDPQSLVALARTGTVLTWTRDYVYPGGDTTEMVVLDLDDGARFYGQVAMGETAPIGTRVKLVPRRLHAGGGLVQYFWKAVPCQ